MLYIFELVIKLHSPVRVLAPQPGQGLCEEGGRWWWRRGRKGRAGPEESIPLLWWIFHFTAGQFKFNPFLVLAEKREIGFLFSNVSNLYSASLNTSWNMTMDLTNSAIKGRRGDVSGRLDDTRSAWSRAGEGGRDGGGEGRGGEGRGGWDLRWRPYTSTSWGTWRLRAFAWPYKYHWCVAHTTITLHSVVIMFSQEVLTESYSLLTLERRAPPRIPLLSSPWNIWPSSSCKGKY